MASLSTCVCLLFILCLLVACPAFGDPTYSECKPHIDATILDLATKAIQAGEKPTQDSGARHVEPCLPPVVHKETHPEPPPHIKEEDVPVKQTPPSPPPPAVKHLPPTPPPQKIHSPPPTAPTAKDTLQGFNKIMHILFGYTYIPRDPKFAEPWNTHPEFAKKVVVTDKTPQTIQKEPGIISKTINKLIRSVFSTREGPRDPKWAEPWQTHKEHIKTPADRKKTAEVKKTSFFNFSFINSFIELIFGKGRVGDRDPKWTKPWQTHQEHLRKSTPAEAKSKKTETVPVQHDGVISRTLNSLISLVFEVPKGQRDAKWTEPWQTHAEHKMKPAKAKENQEVIKIDTKSGAFGQFLNGLVYMVFKEHKTSRSPKWAQPWQTHEEHKNQAQAKKEDSKEKVVKEHNFFGLRPLLNSLIGGIFGTHDILRDSKWAEPWQTHVKQLTPAHASTTKAPPHLTVSKPSAPPTAPTTPPPPKAAPAAPLPKAVPAPPPPATASSPPPKEVPPPPPAAVSPPPPEEVPPPPPAAVSPPPPKEVPPPPPAAVLPPPPKEVPPPPSAVVSPPPLKEIPPPPPPPPTPPASAPTSPPPAKEKVTPTTKEVFPSDTEAKRIRKEELRAGKLPTQETRKKVTTKEKTSPKVDLAKLKNKKAEKVKEKLKEEKKTATEEKTSPKVDLAKLKNKKAEKVKEKLKEEKKTATEEKTSPKVDLAKLKNKKAEKVKEKLKEKEKSTKEAKPHLKVEVKKNQEHFRPKLSTSPKTKPKSDQKRKLEKVTGHSRVQEQKVKDQIPSKHGSAKHQAKSAVRKDESKSRAAPPPERVPRASETPVKQVMEKVETKEESKHQIIEDGEQIVVVPSAFRQRDHIESILGLDSAAKLFAARTDPIAEASLRDLKKIYEGAVKPLETAYKYQDISNRHLSDAELFGSPLILMLGPYSTGKSTFINYLLGTEFTKRALKTGTPPSHGVFRIIKYGEQDRELDGTDLSGHWSFGFLQKFGQNFIDQLRGKELNAPLLKKMTFVEAPGILEMRRPSERLYPFNDVAQWFIDRADLILVMFDYTKLDAGYEMEAVLDQLKGREAQTRILLNKADQVPAEELIKVQGSLFWNLSPLLGVTSPPTVYAGSFTSQHYRSSSPVKLFQAQEEALLHDIAKAVNSRVDNRIAIARRHAVRVRNHAQMVDTYLKTFYKNKGFLTSKHKLAEEIVENPHAYNIYEGMSLLTNISRYDLPDAEVYRDFFRIHNLYDFRTLRETCTYLAGCPLDKVDGAINKQLPELIDKHRRLVEAAAPGAKLPHADIRPGAMGSTAAHVRHSKS